MALIYGDVETATTGRLQRACFHCRFSHDGKPDILYTFQSSPESLHILFNQGNGQFKDQAVSGLNGILGPPSVIDFNLDGIPDLVIQVPQLSGTVVLYSFRVTCPQLSFT